MLARGYAFASTDKGNGGQAFYRDGATLATRAPSGTGAVTELAR